MKISPHHKIVLGSGSPRRKEILELAQLNFEVLVSDVDETYPDKIEAEQVPEYLALQKAQAIQEKWKITNRPIITADTIVLIHQRILGKPKDREDAIQILQQLSGQSHRVLTGVCCRMNDEVKTFTDETIVTFHSIDLKEIEFYVDHFSPMDKAGAYAIQEWIGVRYIQKIEGCYYNVMGLPLPRMIQELF